MPPGRRTLLLADDSPTIQKVISLTFADEGLEVIAVGDGSQALGRLEEDAPDIVLADAVMPGLDGYELCERIKGDARFRHIPVVLLVGTFEPFNEAEARRVGADTVLTKPFQSIRDLVNKVGSLLGGGESKTDEAREIERRRDLLDKALSPETDTHAPGPETEAATATMAGENIGEEEDAGGERDMAASFGDIEMDDQLIEARPAESFGGTSSTGNALMDVEPLEVVDEPFGADAFADEDTPGFTQPEPFEERHAASVHGAASREAGELFASARPAFASRAAEAAAADEALLDIGDIDPSGASAEADDFILDLADDTTPAREASAGVAETPFFDEPEFAGTQTAADDAGAFAEASHGEPVPADEWQGAFTPAHSSAGWEEPSSATAAAEVVTQDEPHPQASGDVFAVQDEGPREEDEMSLARMGAAHEFIEPQVVPADVPSPAEVPAEFTDGSVEGDVAKPPTAPGSFTGDEAGSMTRATAGAAETSTDVVGRAPAAQAGAGSVISPEQLSPEAIEAIARRVVELMSDGVVREIAWEVVPDLAELLIRRRLDEEKR